MSNDMSLGRAILKLSTDNTDLSQGVDQASRKVDGFGGGIKAIKSGVSALGPMIAGAFAVGAIVNAGKAALDYAGRITDISAKLRISTDTAQEWEGVFGEAGVSLDTVARSAAELSARVVGGDKSAVAALQKLGFTVQELKAMQPEDRFNKVADAIGKIQDSGEQLYASKAIFGKGGVELLSALDGHLESNIQRMRDLGIVIDSETIAAADQFGDQLGAMGKQLMAITFSVLGPLLPALSALGNALMWIGSNVIGPVLNVAVKGAMTLLTAFWQTLAGLLAKVADLGAMLPGVGGKFQELSNWLKHSEKVSGEYIASLWDQKAATDAAGQAATAAAPRLMGFGDATEHVDRTAAKAEKTARALAKTLAAHTTELTATTLGTRQFTDALLHEDPVVHNLDVRMQALTTHIQPLETLLPGVTLYMYDWAAAHEKAAETMGAVLQQLTVMPARVQTAGEAFRAEMGQSESSSRSFFGKLGDRLSNVPKMFGDMQQSVASKLSGLFGAGPDSTMTKIVSGGLNFVFGPLSGVAAQLMQQGMQKLGEIALAGLKKIGGFFKNLFGGPSGDELAGRELVEKFKATMTGMASETQLLEAGTDDLARATVVLRDQYMQMGLTEEEALRDMGRLLDSSRDGADATKRVLEEIERKIGGVGRAAATAADSVASLLGGGATSRMMLDLDSLTDPHEREVAATYNQQAIIPMATGGFGRVTKPTLFLAGEEGPEDVAFGGRRGLFDSNGGTTRIENVIQLDGREVHRSERQYAAVDLRRRQKMAAV